MFKISDKKIYINRGDAGTIVLSIPETDSNGYIKYTDTNSNVYWYDKTNNILYDSSYNTSTIDYKTLTLALHGLVNGDVIRFKVFEAEHLEDEPVISKTINITSNSNYVNISLTSTDTKIGDYINEKVNYWYEIELNGDQTIVGYDEDGPKLFILYPEGDGTNA